jgi:hypothetical protein
MSTTRKNCPWCDGEVAADDERRTTSHTVPLCDGYRAFLAKGKVRSIGREVLDDAGRMVARVRYVKFKGPVWHVALDSSKTVCGLLMPLAGLNVRRQRPTRVCENCERQDEREEKRN